MSNEKKKIKIEFAPGCFDDFDGTQEELDEFLAEIQKAVDDGSLFENSVEITEEEFDEIEEVTVDRLTISKTRH